MTDASIHRALILFTSLAITLILLSPGVVEAQHSLHGPRSTGDLESETIPADDQVLPFAPQNLILRFNNYATLLKLTVQKPDEAFVDIGFRYKPIPDRVFVWPLPNLDDAAYYTVEWTALDPRNRPVYGSFRFAFGDRAQPPSQLIEEEPQRHLIVPDYRLLEAERLQRQAP